MSKHMKILLLISMALIVAGLAFTLFVMPIFKVIPIMWGATTSDEVIAMDKKVVTVSGYMSNSSPTDGTCVYITAKPLNGSLFQNENSIDTIVCYAAYGQRLTYTDKCIRMTGKVVGQEMAEDCYGLSYPFYLTECSYEVIEPNETVKLYHEMLDNGIMKSFDTYLSGVYSLMEGNEAAISDTDKEVIKNFDGGPTYTECINGAFSMEEVAQNWYNAGHKVDSEEYTEMVNANTVFIEKLSAWFSSMEMKGTE